MVFDNVPASYVRRFIAAYIARYRRNVKGSFMLIVYLTSLRLLLDTTLRNYAELWFLQHCVCLFFISKAAIKLDNSIDVMLSQLPNVYIVDISFRSQRVVCLSLENSI